MKAKHRSIEEHRILYNEIFKELKTSINFEGVGPSIYFSLKAIFFAGVTLWSYFGILSIQNTFWYILNFMLFGYLCVLMCFNFAHDLSHNSIFKKPAINNVFFEFLYALVGAHPEAWKKRHVHSHHFAPNVKNFDTDLAITGLIRVLPESPLKWYHRYQWLYASIAYSTYSLYWVFIKDFVVLKHYAPALVKRQWSYYIKFVIVKLFYLGLLILLPMIYSPQSVVVVVLAFISMHLFQSLYTLFTFFITHHVKGSNYPKTDSDGIIDTSWFMNQIKSSNDFHPFSHIANFIFGGVNCHIAHHLYPHINHYYYPQVNKILYRHLREHNIEPNITSYFGGVISHLRHLKGLGQY